MEENELYPVIEVPDEEEDGGEYDTEYRRSVKWDFESGDFARNGSNQVMEADGYEAYATWCYKTAQTERGECLAYPEEVGAEMEDALANDDNETVESMIERTITEALEVNPRTEYVRDFEFDWNGDTLHVVFHVKGINWEDVITISL